jgi:predicted CoA-binding protein
MSPLVEKVADFLAQPRIAVAGVSRTKQEAANLIYRRLKSSGVQVVPINPNAESFEGDRCYPDLRSVPGGVDGVVIVTRPETTLAIVRQCPEAGVRRVWMHQSMMRAGTSVSPAAVEFCEQHGITVIAGACPLMFGKTADFGHRCMRWVLGVTGGLPR